MSDNQFPDREPIEAEQLKKINQLISNLVSSNQFYTNKINKASLQFPFSNVGEYTNTFPFTSKEELVEDQQRNPPYGSNLTYPLEDYTRFSQTSGTTGIPLRWLDTPESWQWMLDNWKQVFYSVDLRPQDTLFFAFSFGPFLGFWTAFEAAQQLRCLSITGGGMSSVARLHSIIDNKVTLLCCTPTYAIRLAEVAREEKLNLEKANVRAIIAAGEPGASIPATRQRIEQLWPGARLVDHHGMTEIGPVSYECSKRPGVLHVIESAFIPEINNSETGKSVEVGETGELVLTNLGRIGSPLLRYKTGDMVKNAGNSQCECGTYDLALGGGILGRVDDMVFIRGVNVYPSAIEKVIRAFPEIVEYQVEVDTQLALPELVVEIELEPQCQNSVEITSNLEKAFDVSLSLRIPVKIASSGSLPRFEMKAKRWVKK